MDYWLLAVSQVVLLATLAFLYYKRKYSYWSSRGINGPTPVPLLGNLFDEMRRGQLVTELERSRKYGKLYGIYQSSLPVLHINDPELIKQVLVKDFALFVNRRKITSSEDQASKNLFNLEGEDWKRVRAITSPSFTSGKLKGMNALMHHCIDKLAAYFDTIAKNGQGVINTKEVVSGFTIDVIASTSFATETDSNGAGSATSPFIKHGMGLFKINYPRMLIQMFAPVFLRRIIAKYWPSEHFMFFKNLGVEIVKHRRETGMKRNDFVQLLMDAYVEESELKDSSYESLEANDEKDDESNTNKFSSAKIVKRLSDNEIIGQIFIFFLAGFETTASAISHTIFHLARQPEIQNRLVQDLNEALDGVDINSEQYYDTVMHKIPYLDAVIKETLRMYPPLTRLERRVGIDGYKLGGIELEKEQLVTIGTYAVHRNPEYYPDPDVYNPERFMPENKHLLTPYTWLPFGHGPRNCVGMRFAYQEFKLCLAKILPQFKFTPTEETPDKMDFAKIGLLVVKPFPLKVSRR